MKQLSGLVGPPLITSTNREHIWGESARLSESAFVPYCRLGSLRQCATSDRNAAAERPESGGKAFICLAISLISRESAQVLPRGEAGQAETILGVRGRSEGRWGPGRAEIEETAIDRPNSGQLFR